MRAGRVIFADLEPDPLGIVLFLCAPSNPVLSEINGHSCRVGSPFFLLDEWMGILTCSGLMPGHDWVPWARGNSYRWRGSSPCDDRMCFAYSTSPVKPSSSVSHLPKEPLRQRKLRFSGANDLGGASSQGTAWDDDSHFCSFLFITRAKQRDDVQAYRPFQAWCDSGPPSFTILIRPFIPLRSKLRRRHL